MKAIIAILFVPVAMGAAICLSGCSKHNIQTENGSINNIPALTLYGSSGQESDYLFIVFSTNTTDKRIFYQGTTYTYSGISSTNNIYVIATPTSIINCTIDTLSAQTVLTINTTPSIFESSIYKAK